MMRKAVILAVAVGLPLLSGCSSLEGLWTTDEAPQQREMVQHRLGQLTEDINGCTANRKSGQLATHVDYALCVNRVFQAAMSDVNYPYTDIIATLSAERLRVAELADKGEISEAEGLARISDKISEVVRLERARSNSFGQQGQATPPQYFLQLMQIGL